MLLWLEQPATARPRIGKGLWWWWSESGGRGIHTQMVEVVPPSRPKTTPFSAPDSSFDGSSVLVVIVLFNNYTTTLSLSRLPSSVSLSRRWGKGGWLNFDGDRDREKIGEDESGAEQTFVFWSTSVGISD